MRNKKFQIRDFNIKSLASLISLIGLYEASSLKFFYKFIENCFDVGFYKGEDSIDKPANFKYWSKIFGTFVHHGYIN